MADAPGDALSVDVTPGRRVGEAGTQAAGGDVPVGAAVHPTHLLSPASGTAAAASAPATPHTPLSPSQRIDRFGFVVEGELTETPEQRAARVKKEQERLAKWCSMLKQFAAFERDNSRLVRRRVRKGIPQEVRGQVWKLFAGVDEQKALNRGVYERLLRPRSVSERQIELDLARTFPKQVLFMQQQGRGQQLLSNVLRAYSLYDAAVGYCQGMGFIAALLLIFMEEEDAFWLLVQLLNKYGLAGLFTTGMPTVSMMLAMLKPLMRKFVPRLAERMETLGVDPSFFAASWLITAFTSDFPMAFVVRLWDIFLAEGVKILFRFVLAFLKMEEESLLQCNFEQMLKRLKDIPNRLEERNIESVVDVALDLPLTEKFLQQCMERYEAEGGRMPTDGRVLLLKKPALL